MTVSGHLSAMVLKIQGSMYFLVNYVNQFAFAQWSLNWVSVTLLCIIHVIALQHQRKFD